MRLLVLVCVLVVWPASSLVYPYDEAVARRLCRYAFAAYASAAVLPWRCDCCQGLAVPPPLLVNDTRANLLGFVTPADPELQGAAVVAFRGTQGGSLKNWIEDLHASKTTPYRGDPNVRVHKGFDEAYELLRTQVHDILDAIQPSHVIVTGHSLGAALAQLCAADLQQAYPNVRVEVLSFGTPRTGNQAWSSFIGAALAGRLMRITHWRDIVTAVPPEHLGFYHTPHEAFFSETFNLIATCEEAESKNCTDSLLFHDSIPDHLCYYNMSNDRCRAETC